jgi:hypothetical protein
MALIKFIVAIFSVFKEPKAAASALAMSTAVAGGGYALIDQVNAVTAKVDEKHDTAMTEIAKNREDMSSIMVAQQTMIVQLQSIKEGVNDTKANVEKTRDRVWQIGRDVYILKSKTN